MYSKDYSIDLNNDELNIFFKEEIQKFTVDYVKALEKYRKDYVEFDHLDYDFEKYKRTLDEVQEPLNKLQIAMERFSEYIDGIEQSLKN